MIGIYNKYEERKGVFTKRSPQTPLPSPTQPCVNAVDRPSLQPNKGTCYLAWKINWTFIIFLYTTTMLRVEVLQVFVSTAAPFEVGLSWINFNEKVYETVCHLIAIWWRKVKTIVGGRRKRKKKIRKPFNAIFTKNRRKKKTWSAQCRPFMSFILKIKKSTHKMADNKLINTIMGAATLTCLY